jgi:prepilin-type N-terminal cleavage/methylation domain-containing protein
MLLYFRHLGRRCLERRGFTLIELLIVIAIILILISIALPNFLEAQERARVAKAKGNLKSMETAGLQHQTYYGFLYADYNDPGTVVRKSRNKSSPVANLPCPINSPLITSKGGLQFISDPATSVGDRQRYFYAPQVHCPLTTPQKFIDASKCSDPWSDGTIPVGMDSRYDNTGARGDDPKFIRYCAYFVAGPDRIAGHWDRGFSAYGGCPGNNTGRALSYSPTNGTRSCGELWFTLTTDVTFTRREYNPLNSF